MQKIKTKGKLSDIGKKIVPWILVAGFGLGIFGGTYKFLSKDINHLVDYYKSKRECQEAGKSLRESLQILGSSNLENEVSEKYLTFNLAPVGNIESDSNLQSLIIDEITKPLESPINKSSLESDSEHARFCGNIAHKGAIIFQANKGKEADNYNVSDGKMFSLKNSPPIIKIRPIDGGQTIHVKGDISYSFRGSNIPRVEIEVDVPFIFDPQLALDSLVIDNQKIPVSNIKWSYNNNLYRDKPSFKLELDLEKLVDKNMLDKSAVKDEHVNIEYKLRMNLDEYKTRLESDFGSFEQLKRVPEYVVELAKTEPNAFLDSIAKKLAKENETPYKLAKAIFEFTRKSMQYHDEELFLNPDKAIKEGKGDCDDYSEIMVDLLRRVGIPAIDGSESIKDFDISGGHAFPIFALPLKDGTFVWILSEPTWAEKEKNPDNYFQQKDRSYLLGMEININTLNSKDKLECLTVYSCGTPTGKLKLPDLENKILTVFNSMAKELKDKKISFPMKYKQVRSNYFYLKEKSTKNGDLLIKINNDDQLRIGYESKKGKYLSSPEDEEQIKLLKKVYKQIQETFGFEKGNEALHFFTSRNKYNDKIEFIQIRVSPYIVERSLPQIINILQKNKFIIDSKDKKKIMEVYSMTQNRNIYHILNLSRNL